MRGLVGGILIEEQPSLGAVCRGKGGDLRDGVVDVEVLAQEIC
jgi:hypothetical protein